MISITLALILVQSSFCVSQGLSRQVDIGSYASNPELDELLQEALARKNLSRTVLGPLLRRPVATPATTEASVTTTRSVLGDSLANFGNAGPLDELYTDIITPDELTFGEEDLQTTSAPLSDTRQLARPTQPSRFREPSFLDINQLEPLPISQGGRQRVQITPGQVFSEASRAPSREPGSIDTLIEDSLRRDLQKLRLLGTRQENQVNADFTLAALTTEAPETSTQENLVQDSLNENAALDQAANNATDDSVADPLDNGPVADPVGVNGYLPPPPPTIPYWLQALYARGIRFRPDPIFGIPYIIPYLAPQVTRTVTTVTSAAATASNRANRRRRPRF